MKSYKVILFLCITLCLAGCGKQETEPVKEWFGETRDISYGEQGLIAGQDALYFLERETGTMELICTDATCDHGKECSAYFSDVIQMKASIEGEKLLLVTDYLADKLGALYLYEAELDGSNRKELAYLGNMQNGFQFMFLEDYIVFDFWNNYNEDMVPLEEDVAGVYMYNKRTGEGNVVWRIEGLNARIPGMAYWNDEVYFFSFYVDGEIDESMTQDEMREYMESHQKNQFCKLSLTDGSIEVLDDAAGNFFGAAAMEGKVFCNYDFQLYVYDTDTGERTLFSEEDYRPLESLLGDKVVFWKNSEYYVYSEEEGMQSVGTLENCSVLAVFPTVVYAERYISDTYAMEYVYYDTEDFLNGRFNKVKVFAE